MSRCESRAYFLDNCIRITTVVADNNVHLTCFAELDSLLMRPFSLTSSTDVFPSFLLPPPPPPLRCQQNNSVFTFVTTSDFPFFNTVFFPCFQGCLISYIIFPSSLSGPPYFTAFQIFDSLRPMDRNTETPTGCFIPYSATLQ